MSGLLEEILRDLGITDEHLSANLLSRCEQPSLKELEIVDIDFEGKPFILTIGAAAAWREMQAAASAQGISLKPFSGFRSYLHQKRLIERHLEKGRDLRDILTHIAIPGFSEHHGGRAVDIYSGENSILEEAFEVNARIRVVSEKCRKFSFPAELSAPK